ncbi:MAG: hypothetical protein Q8L44_10935 [Sulfuritalea sp.]|nr:hypothetical protein [Sulfuritalea sp.]
MSTITQAAQSVLKCAVMVALASSLAANAAAPVPPVAPPPAPKPKIKPYGGTVQNAVTAAYEYRTRILEGKPECRRFATESDTAFLDDKMQSEAKVALLQKIGAAAEANGCLAR